MTSQDYKTSSSRSPSQHEDRTSAAAAASESRRCVTGRSLKKKKPPQRRTSLINLNKCLLSWLGTTNVQNNGCKYGQRLKNASLKLVFFLLFQLETLTLRANAASEYSERFVSPVSQRCLQSITVTSWLLIRDWCVSCSHLGLHRHHSAQRHQAHTPSQRDDLRGWFPVSAHQARWHFHISYLWMFAKRGDGWIDSFVWAHWCTDKTFVWSFQVHRFSLICSHRCNQWLLQTSICEDDFENTACASCLMVFMHLIWFLNYCSLSDYIPA